jgi:hypothetical protein
MASDPRLLDLATEWRPQRPGRKPINKIDDALVEPDWEGLHVVAALDEDAVVLVHQGQSVAIPDELPTALLAAFRAMDALVEGRLTTTALWSGEGAGAVQPTVERQAILIPRIGRPRTSNDAFMRSRDHVRREEAEAPGTVDALASGERHAFVATDLLWLDGTPLVDIPLLERKRLLDGVLEPSLLVRITPFVRPTAGMMLATWGTQGFRELHYRAANSRYLTGAENPDCAVARPPSAARRPSGSATRVG